MRSHLVKPHPRFFFQALFDVGRNLVYIDAGILISGDADVELELGLVPLCNNGGVEPAKSSVSNLRISYIRVATYLIIRFISVTESGL